MDSIIAFLKHYLGEYSPLVVIILILGSLLMFFIEKKLESIVQKVDEIGKTSLQIKQEIRGEERDSLVDFRVKVERWEDFLQNALIDYSMMSPNEVQIKDLYEKDKELFLDVKISAVKASIYLRDKDLENKLISLILKIRKTCYPIMNEIMPRLIDSKIRLAQIEIKLDKFKKSGYTDLSSAPTKKDREEALKLQNTITKELQEYSEKYIQQYRLVAEQLNELKEAINYYIYRPVNSTSINKD